MAIGSLSEAQIYIDDTPGITVSDIRAKCRRLKKERGLGMILIDYLQLIHGRGKAGENRQQEVSEISRTLEANRAGVGSASHRTIPAQPGR